jgi:MEMO1 family protein
MPREAAYAGQFYPGTASELRSMIESCIEPEAEKEAAIGVLAPHAGYIYSGVVTGAVISRIIFQDTFIIIGPNHTGRGQPFSIMTEGSWKTPLGEVQIDTEIARKLLSISAYLREDKGAHEFEHAVEVQLPFLQYFKQDVRFVPIMMAGGNGEIYRKIGSEIAQTLRELRREAVILASSDMNHYESQATSKKKDFRAIEAMLDMNPDELVKRVEDQNITMCGYAPAAVMLTAARELGASSARLVKYQTSGDVSGDLKAVVGYAGIIVKKLSPLVNLARETVELYVRKRQVFRPPELTSEMREKAGVFVCIKKDGELRGCIGTFEPEYENVASEIVANAISTATRDPRFTPIQVSELKFLDYTVDVLTSPQPVSGKEKLDAKKYGVIVESGYRRGLLLPDLEGVDTVEQQIDICRQKAGIDVDEPVNLYRFEVKRYK